MTRYIHILITAIFIGSSLPFPVQAGQFITAPMPAPGTMSGLSPAFTPAHLLGLSIHPEDGLKFDFLIQRGNQQLAPTDKQVEYQRLIKYFLASLTIPDKDQWVNLSPYEKDRIVAGDFGKTEMGRQLLAQDYLLKQISSSLMHPDSGMGKEFWNKVYALSYQKFGNTNIPVSMFNKVWIVPDKVTVLEKANTVYIIESHLKVMLEEDYLAQAHAVKVTDTFAAAAPAAANVSVTFTQAIRDVILPALEKEVNEGKNFAALRQVFSAMILATWYKKAIKDSILGKVYADKSKVRGIESAAPSDIEAIYQQYLTAFKKGAYNFIKEDVDAYTRQAIPRKYFAGGINGIPEGLIKRIDAAQASPAQLANAAGIFNTALHEGIDRASVSIGAAQQRTGNADAAMITGVEDTDIDDYVHRVLDKGMNEPVRVYLKKTPGAYIDQVILKAHKYVLLESIFVFETPDGVTHTLHGSEIRTIRVQVLPAGYRYIPYAEFARQVTASNLLTELPEFAVVLNKKPTTYMPVKRVVVGGQEKYLVGGGRIVALADFPLSIGNNKYNPAHRNSVWETASYNAVHLKKGIYLNTEEVRTVVGRDHFDEVWSLLLRARGLEVAGTTVDHQGTGKLDIGVRLAHGPDYPQMDLHLDDVHVVQMGNGDEMPPAENKAVMTVEEYVARVEGGWQGYVSLNLGSNPSFRTSHMKRGPDRNVYVHGVQLHLPVKVNSQLVFSTQDGRVVRLPGQVIRSVQIIEDLAMSSAPDPVQTADTDVGGIDFNGTRMEMDVKRDSQGIALTVDRQDLTRLEGLPGLQATILDIQPVTTLPVSP